MDTITKNPLHYQISEYDCGPTSVLNALSYLFPREAVPPEVIRNVMLYCLDCYNAEGIPGKNGTSTAAMKFLSNWLNGFGRTGHLKISARYLSGRQVFLGQESLINDALRRGGVAVVRLYYEEAHYVLMTGVDEQLQEPQPGQKEDTAGQPEGREETGASSAVNRRILMFDPYYEYEPFEEKDVALVLDEPFRYNRIVPEYYFNRENFDLYALGPYEGREAVLLFNETTEMTSEETIEYFI